ncbi:hypothetical protein DFLDMN_006183 (plasmid) [Cupriavidus sp. H19C3]
MRGPRLERLEWLGRYQRVTARLAQACGQLLRSCTVQAVAAFYDLGRHTVKSIDKARLQAVHLDEVLQANQPLMTVYILRDELKRLWFYRRPGWAQKAWENWCEQARQCGIPALQMFAKRLSSYWHGIIARCRHPLNTSVDEGINNTSRSSSAEPTATATRNASSSKSALASPEFLDEPKIWTTWREFMYSYEDRLQAVRL